MQQIQLQRATLLDLKTVQHTGIETYKPYYPHIWKPGGLNWYLEHCFGDDVLLHDLENPNIHYYLPHDINQQVIGILKLHPEYPMPDSAVTNVLYLEKIYLMPAFYKQGMGQRLLQCVEQMAQAWGKSAIWLQVMQQGPVGAYEKAGYHIIGVTRFEFDFLKEDMRSGWIMSKTL